MLETQTISFNFFYVDKIIGAIGSIESYEGWRARQQPPPLQAQLRGGRPGPGDLLLQHPVGGNRARRMDADTTAP
jgi:hypothetical protein